MKFRKSTLLENSWWKQKTKSSAPPFILFCKRTIWLINSQERLTFLGPRSSDLSILSLIKSASKFFKPVDLQLWRFLVQGRKNIFWSASWCPNERNIINRFFGINGVLQPSWTDRSKIEFRNSTLRRVMQEGNWRDQRFQAIVFYMVISALMGTIRKGLY